MQKLFVKKLKTAGDDDFNYKEINKLIETIKIKQISCGYYHIILLDQQNNIYTCGRNSDGQLGLSHKNSLSYFEKINTFNNNVKIISAGGYSSIILTLNNKIYGTGTILNCLTFKEIDNEINEIKKIKSGGGFTIAMNNKNELFGFGKNQYYQLGIGVSGTESKFIKLNLPISSNCIKDYFCGYMYTAILTNDGDVYCCGSDINKSTFKTFTKLELNVKCKDIGCVFDNFYLLTFNNELYFNGNKLTFTKSIKKIYSGLGFCTYLLTEENEIYNINKSEIEKFTENCTFNLPYLFIYPAYGALTILNSDYNLEEEESRQVVRMKKLLFEKVKSHIVYNDVVVIF